MRHDPNPMSRRKHAPDAPPAPTAEDDEFAPSRTELRRARKHVQETLEFVTRELCALTPNKLASLALDPAHAAEIARLRDMRKGGALARQRRYVASLLRAYDLDELVARVAKLRAS